MLLQVYQNASVVVESSITLFANAVSFSLSVEKNLFIVDQDNNTLSVVSANNSIVETLGGRGWGTESFDTPTDITSTFVLDIFVVDYSNRRIMRFDKNLHFAQIYNHSSIGVDERFRPIACGISRQGDMFIVDVDANRVIRTNSRGQMTGEFGSLGVPNSTLSRPKDIAVSRDDEVMVLDKSNVLIYDRFGNYASTIELPKDTDWKSISLTDSGIVATSSSQICILNRLNGESRIVNKTSIIGASIKEPFSDALLVQNTLNILTASSLYRCSFSQ